MPLITVAIACVTNIFGDLLLVDVFQMGAAGAALATVFAQAVSVILSLFVIMRRKLPFTFRKEQLRFDRPLTAGILRLGIPIALQDVLVGVSFLVILAIVNSLGLLQSAGMGIAEKVCAFVMLLPSAFSQSVSAFVAQNTGAGKPERAKKALRYSVAVSLCISVFVFYFNFFHGDLLAGIFANDHAVILEAADYLKAYAIDCLLTSFLFCFVGYFSGLGKTVFVMTQGILGAFGVRIPVSFAMSRLPNVRLFYIHGAAVEDGDRAGDLGAVLRLRMTARMFADLFRPARRRGLARADGPDGLVGDDHLADLVLADGGKAGLDLHCDPFRCDAGFPLLQALAAAQDGDQAVVQSGEDLGVHVRVRLAHGAALKSGRG